MAASSPPARRRRAARARGWAARAPSCRACSRRGPVGGLEAASFGEGAGNPDANELRRGGPAVCPHRAPWAPTAGRDGNAVRGGPSGGRSETDGRPQGPRVACCRPPLERGPARAPRSPTRRGPFSRAPSRASSPRGGNPLPGNKREKVCAIFCAKDGMRVSGVALGGMF